MPSRMAAIRQMRTITHISKDGEKLELTHIAGGNITWVQPLWKSLAVPQF